MATSAKRALEGALKVALERGDKNLGRGHIVLALLRAERGTVPRALECAGVERRELRDAVAAAI
jgi:ATP-dependent Clp protease ATP-binding subunit ClpA